MSISNNYEISVIVPVYNVEQTLRRCVDSIINQSFVSYEIILVDDGSPDNSGAICDEYAACNPNISVIHKTNGGLSSARLAGYQHARGRFLAFVDSDDYIHPDFLKQLYHAVSHNRSSMAICSYYLTTEDGKSTSKKLPYAQDILQDIHGMFILPLIGANHKESVTSMPGFLCLRLVEKKLVDEDFFVPENVYYAEDIIFNLLIAQKLDKVALVNRPLYYYCFNRASLTGRYRENAWRMQMNLFHFISDYCTQWDIEATRRLTNRLYSCVCYTVLNASKHPHYEVYQSQIADMRKSCECEYAIRHFSWFNSTFQQKVIFTLLRFNFYKLLYSYCRWRLHL